MAKKTIREEIRTPDLETGEIIVTPAITIEDESVEEIDRQMRKAFKAFFKTPNNHNTEVAAKRSATKAGGQSMTQQHEKEHTDINAIMRRFGVTGVAPGAKTVLQHYDVPELDMQTAIATVRAGQEAFDRMPAITRAYFRNDIALFTAAVEDRKRAGDHKTLEQFGLGIIPPPEPPEPADKTPKEPPPTPPKGGKEPKGSND